MRCGPGRRSGEEGDDTGNSQTMLHEPVIGAPAAMVEANTLARVRRGAPEAEGAWKLELLSINTIRTLAMDAVQYVFTHDSIGLGEDGPTHQPIEQLMSLRAIPRMVVIRPADANETAEAWRVAMMSKERPVALVLTRQAVPTFDRTRYAGAEGLRRGAYVMADSLGAPQVIRIGTGSEVQLCVEAHQRLTEDGINSRVVSMPSWELFKQQSQEYQNTVLPPEVHARIVVEAGTGLGWREYVGFEGRVIAHYDFGASAPIKDLLKHFGFTAEHVVEAARSLVKK